jgi:hypothetical protein
VSINPHSFDEHKLAYESRERAVDRLLEYQTDARSRVDTLVKAIFVLSGGALTISIGIFLRNDAPQLSPDLANLLRWSWDFLAYSLAAAATLLFLMICQGYMHAERVERRIRDRIREHDSPPAPPSLALFLVRILNWLLGITGFISFLIGFALLVHVAVDAVPGSDAAWWAPG